GTYGPDGTFTPSTTDRPFQNYEGDVEAIMRETFIRAIEVSLGLDNGEDVNSATRFWPIEYFWKCPTAWVEGWVTWRQEVSGEGHVTVHLLTPAHGHPVLSDPKAGAHPTINPTSSSDRFGMWVVTYDHHDKSIQMVRDESEFAVWNFPTLGPVYTGVAPVVV